MVLFSIGAAEAALTEQQVNAALGSVPGVAWSIDGPNADAWTVTSGPALTVASALRDEVYSLTATVTGPGVLELASIRTSSVFEGGIEVDGVARTGFNFNGASRVIVGKGAHTVKFKAVHWRFNDEPVSATFNGVKWEPYNVMGLYVGEADGSVSLSGDWLGQDRWHHDDGGAVFSGGVNVAAQVLRGDFTGPGVLLYQTNSRTAVSFALDGGAVETMGTTYGEWKREWYPAGDGAHVATWTGGQSTEATIDEVKVVPEVDLATALETPGRVWTSTTSGVWRAVGVPMEDALGGSSVLLDSKVKLSSDFPGQGILRVRYRTGSPEGYINGSKLTSTTLNSTMEWRTKVISVPAGGGTVALDSTLDTEIDRVEWEPLLTTVAETLGLPVGTTTTGGEGGWTITPNLAVGMHVVKTSLTPAAPTAWVSSTLTGPARVTLYCEANQNGTLDFLLDGVEVWDSQAPYSDRVTLEIPAGQHVLRAEARATTATAGSPFVAEIREMKVEQLLRGEVITEALGFPAKWTYVGAWTKAEYPSFDGDGSLQPRVPEETDGSVEMTAWLGTTVTGPGYLSFRSRQVPGDPVMTMYGDTISGAVPVTSHSADEWTETRQWFPAGTHKVQLKVQGTAWGISRFYLDEMRFEPSDAGLLAGISIGAPLVLQNDPEHPWLISKAPDGPVVAVSPFREAGQEAVNHRISTTVTGPGTLSFRLKRQGGGFTYAWLMVDGDYASVAQGEPMIAVIPAGTHQLEWIASDYYFGSWTELSEVDWLPWTESSLASALDTPEGVAWESGGDAQFKGMTDPAATNGAGAYIELEAGASSWLEATMQGPGVFDFSLLESSGSAVDWRDAAWVVTVDGVEARRSNGHNWEPIWVRGEGEHKVRLTFTNPTGGTITGLVDDVKWIPLVQRTMDGTWSSNVSEATNGYIGVDGGGWILRTSYYTPSWIEKTVTGPCEVTWDSHVVGDPVWLSGEPKLTVDGKAAMIVPWEDQPTRNTLIIPAGTHVIRWANETRYVDHGEELPVEEQLRGSYWQISDPVVTPGVSPIAEAIDAPDTCWLVQGSGGEVITGSAAMDGVDAYDAASDSRFYYLNLTDSTQWLRMGIYNPGTMRTWQTFRAEVDAGSALELLVYNMYPLAALCNLDGCSAVTLTDIPLNEAVEFPGEVESWTWRSIASADSYEGEDCAWSFINQKNESQSAWVILNAPGTIRFRWKQEGGTALRLRLNGALMPMIASSTWEEVTLQVGNGTNVIEWRHQDEYGSAQSSPGEAWVDAVSFVESPSWELSALGSGVELSATGEDSWTWKAVSTTMPGGEVVTAARTTSGSSVMSATITGPKILNFRSACFAGAGMPPPAEDLSRMAPRFDMGGGGTGSGPPTYELTVRLDGDFYGRITQKSVVYWDDSTMLIPAGTHEVTWQLCALTSGVRTPASLEGLQGWVTDLRVESTRGRFDRWAEELPAGKRGPDDDADGDGVSNLLEYAFRSGSTDASSKPPKVDGYRSSSGSSYQVMVPYLSNLVTGTLQSSDDMKTWIDHPVQWLESKPTTGSHTATHQAVIIPLSPEDKAWFFHVKVAVGE